jgi:Domain of unknown function (DUF4249)
MNRRFHKAPLLFICVAAGGCLQTYIPPPIANPAADLVVEGFIDNGGDSTIFSLSRTFPLSALAATPELKAKVVVEGNDNTSYPLPELGNGLYGALLSGLNPATTYRLYITTSAGKQYASDYVPLVTDPPIDSINWVRNNSGVTIYANTHDPTGNTRYFRWDYTETYEFNSTYVTYYNVSGRFWVPMIQGDTLYTCWHTDNSTNIILASSSQLAQAVIYEAPIVNYPVNSQQLSVEYSVLIRQYALTKAAYTWWATMQNNTENIGSIFGVEPTTNEGNLHCLTDTTEQVVGYASAGNSWSQRIFITNQQVAPWTYVDNGCTISVFSQPLLANAANGFWYLYPQQVPIPGFAYTQAECANCLTNGYNHPPSFWP